jgi:hypothetical protein
MRDDGEALMLTYENGEAVWRLLHSGRRISPRAAKRIMAAADVRPSDAALFPEMPAQTYVTRTR